ncbi:hypothetical protein R75465_02219 [Paraburkholderia aspalathi]|nr:hypothetical protein R75465_02219 [Paraburkholderia aspalathi]
MRKRPGQQRFDGDWYSPLRHLLPFSRYTVMVRDYYPFQRTHKRTNSQRMIEHG